MEKKWVKIPYEKDNSWYMLSNYGDIYKEREAFFDKKGRRRSKKSNENRKLYKTTVKYDISKYLDDRGYIRVIMFTRQFFLHRLVAQYFIPNEKNYPFVKIKNGNKEDIRSDNLQWVTHSEFNQTTYQIRAWQRYKAGLPPAEKIETRVKIYEVPKSHSIYKEYMEYLDNRSKTSELAFQFMRRNGLFSGMIKTGYEKKENRRNRRYDTIETLYFHIYDKDPAILQHDIDKLGLSVLKKPIDGYYGIRKNSTIMQDWKNTLMYNNDFKIMDVPSIKDYVTLHDTKTSVFKRNTFAKSFVMHKKKLYVRIESEHKFDAYEFEEVQHKEHLFKGGDKKC